MAGDEGGWKRVSCLELWLAGMPIFHPVSQGNILGLCGSLPVEHCQRLGLGSLPEAQPREAEHSLRHTPPSLKLTFTCLSHMMEWRRGYGWVTMLGYASLTPLGQYLDETWK
ncbi:hypothetical protein DPEC_G00211490 [Dallia pectoralis]|uniref:Uncharacterized protein n=1 Tax=Dallia pectoralis TaxID=75939 RepID=A0ACC2G685_DALPE|nr:hypothetical protein DPEC_G00211490 [Dallia pectoralis]